jgi:hypothetical protein
MDVNRRAEDETGSIEANFDGCVVSRLYGYADGIAIIESERRSS